MAESRAAQSHHEAAGVDARLVLAVGAGVGVALVLVVALMYGLWRLMLGQGGSALTPPAPPPVPRLQAHPQTDLAHMRSATTERLTRYAWLDGKHAFARIPIDRAMMVLLRQSAERDSHSPQPQPADSGGSQ